MAEAEYRARGWTRFDRFFTDAELAALQAEADRLIALPELFCAEGRGAVANSEGRNDRLDPVIDLSAMFAACARDPRLLAIARTLLGGEPVFFKDRFIAKPPGAGGYGAHQDAAYWQDFGVADGDFVTLAICLDPMSEANGAVEGAEGEHHRLLSERGRIADVPEDAALTFAPMIAAAGDVLAIHSLLPHRSGANRTDAPRRTLFFVYALGSADLNARYRASR